MTRVQRALNAAGSSRLAITGSYNTATGNAIGAYQRKVGISATKVVASRTWAALRGGRLTVALTAGVRRAAAQRPRW